MAKQSTTSEIIVSDLRTSAARFVIIGRTPLIVNRLSEKAKHELLLPRGKKTSGDKASSLKHDPISEFRASAYLLEEGPTLLGFPSIAFKKAMSLAALEMPGMKKAQILRLVYMPKSMISIYGIPKLFCAVTRSADMNKTPDIRTRCIVPEWAAEITVEYPTPHLNETSVGTLLHAAGFISGVGDWRQEKGSGSFGSFRLGSPDDPEYLRIVSSGGREAQQKAFENPEPYDSETEELLTWFEEEVSKRGKK